MAELKKETTSAYWDAFVEYIKNTGLSDLEEEWGGYEYAVNFMDFVFSVEIPVSIGYLNRDELMLEIIRLQRIIHEREYDIYELKSMLEEQKNNETR